MIVYRIQVDGVLDGTSIFAVYWTLNRARADQLIDVYDSMGLHIDFSQRLEASLLPHIREKLGLPPS